MLLSLCRGTESCKDPGIVDKNLHSYIYLARWDYNNRCTSLFTLRVNQKARRKIDVACRWQRAMKQLLIFQAV